jgi:Cu/Ag efflux pump CusA
MATGAGAGAQKAIGTCVLGGMITATSLAIFFIPLFYVVILRAFRRNGSSSSQSLHVIHKEEH